MATESTFTTIFPVKVKPIHRMMMMETRYSLILMKARTRIKIITQTTKTTQIRENIAKN